MIDVDPAEAKASLEAISRTSRSSLAEVRRILGALRTQTGERGYHPPLGFWVLAANPEQDPPPPRGQSAGTAGR